MFSYFFSPIAVLSWNLLSVTALPAINQANPPTRLLGSREDGYTFSLQARKPAGSVNASLNSLVAKSYIKRGLEVPEEFAVAVERNELAARSGVDTDTVTVDQDWYAPITIGTPAQHFLMLPDSGSPDFFVISTAIPDSLRGGAPLYNPGASSSAQKKAGYSFSMSYASGAQVSGDVYTDVVTIGSLSFTNFAFEVATHVTEKDSGVRSGNWGLNFDAGGQQTSPTKLGSWFQAVKPFLKAGLWTVDLHKGGTGTYDFGYIDPTKYTGRIGYGPVSETGGEWIVTIQGFSVGTDGKYLSSSFHTIIDTGTAVSQIPRWVADIYFARVPGSVYNDNYNTYAYPCTAVLPEFNFGVASTVVTIPGHYLDYATIDNGKTCISQLFTTTGLPIWGSTFIEAMFIVLDWDNARVGFANKLLA